MSLRKLDELAGLHAGHSAQIERSPDRSVETKTVRQLASVFAGTEEEQQALAAWLAFGTGAAPSGAQIEAARARAGKRAADEASTSAGLTVDRSADFDQRVTEG